MTSCIYNPFFLSLDPIRSYHNEDLMLILPGDLTLDKIEWFAVYDLKKDKPLAYLSGLTTDYNVPPYLGEIYVTF